MRGRELAQTLAATRAIESEEIIDVGMRCGRSSANKGLEAAAALRLRADVRLLRRCVTARSVALERTTDMRPTPSKPWGCRSKTLTPTPEPAGYCAGDVAGERGDRARATDEIAREEVHEATLERFEEVDDPRNRTAILPRSGWTPAGSFAVRGLRAVVRERFAAWEALTARSSTTRSIRATRVVTLAATADGAGLRRGIEVSGTARIHMVAHSGKG